jgi:hypothetical protein
VRGERFTCRATAAQERPPERSSAAVAIRVRRFFDMVRTPWMQLIGVGRRKAKARVTEGLGDVNESARMKHRVENGFVK